MEVWPAMDDPKIDRDIGERGDSNTPFPLVFGIPARQGIHEKEARGDGGRQQKQHEQNLQKNHG
jgi:hypothetical protein